MARLELSVVIVTFNNKSEIGGCLSALLEELQGSRWQLTVIDNCSEDGTRKILEEIFPKILNCELELICNDDNIQFTRALNQGLKKSAGDYILILNPDTRVRRSSIGILKKSLRDNPHVGVTAPQLLNANGAVQPSCRRFPRRRDVLFEVTGLSRLFKRSKVFNCWKMGDFDHLERRYVDQPQGACLFCRRDVLEVVGLWDEGFPMFFSDVDWCRRVKSAGYEILFEPAAKVVHHKGASVYQRRPAMIWSSHRSFYRYFIKHDDRPEFFVANRLTGLVLLTSAVPRMFVAWLKKHGRNVQVA
ncbi:MAG TPA: glycosyltransferase family 2 protein [bacterium]